MIRKYFQKIIGAIILITILTFAAAQAQTEGQSYSGQKLSREELAQMLAPIALYPDPLLSQLLIASSYPFEVVEAERWTAKNPGLGGDSLDNALMEKNWDVSVLSLCHYPKILNMMSENLNWTASLGDAFVNQEQDVMDAVQELRMKANNQGNLTSTGEQKVVAEGNSISIEPASPDYIYVPVYDPFVIYGSWWYPAFPPFRISYPGILVTGPRIIFSSRLFVRSGVVGWSRFNWRERNIVIVNIERTGRFNRHAHSEGGADRVYWRPDRERRLISEKRSREIPQVRRPGVPPQRVLEPDRRGGGEIKAPDNRKSAPERLPATGRDKRQEVVPQVIERDKRPEKAPAVSVPERGKPAAYERSALRTDDSKKAEPAKERREEFRKETREERGRDSERATPQEARGERPDRSTGGGRGGVREERR
jgi:hypothetical protein